MILTRTSSTYSLDPISVALQPPRNETRKQRALRLKAEAKAKRLSDQIDEELKQEQERLKRNRDVKLLLFGEAESVVEQFQLMYKPHLIEQERISLKTVIYLHVVRALKHILITLETCSDTAEDETDYSSEPHSRRPGASRIADLRRRLEPLVSVDELLAHRLHEVKQGRDSQGDILTQDVAHRLWSLEKDIQELWGHITVRALIAKRRLTLDKGSEFFLEHITRLADLNYFPTTDDILHARIRSIGVQEHIFDVNTIPWYLYDVGGARGQRHSWVPYFDDINAVIFVVPISDFDQYLEEGPRINRIHNSLQQFTQICSNRLLKRTSFVLILSKIGLLKEKLDRGLEVRKYIPSFGDRNNDCATVIQYLHKHFLKAYKRHNTRGIYIRHMDVIDAKATRCIIDMVCNSILQAHLESAKVL